MTKKTRKELEKQLSYWIKFGIIITIMFLVFTLVMLIFPSFQYKYRALEQELSECQEQVPNYDNESSEANVSKIPMNLTNFKPFWMGYSEDEIPKNYIKLIIYEKSCWTDGGNCVYYRREVYFPKNCEVRE